MFLGNGDDFDKNEQDISDLRDIIDNNKGIIMDGTWRAPIKDDFGFDEEDADKEAPEVEAERLKLSVDKRHQFMSLIGCASHRGM